ncbi:MAG: ATP-binding cassette domain-containing protein, partial [Thomasclavelia spiroformis]
IGNQSYLFKGTVRDNLCMAKKDASDKELWDVLKQVNLSQYFKEQQGLDTKLLEKASNLSGGQRQRLALARALLHDSLIYIFDEATSNIDVESENEIINQIYELSKTKTIIMISHRLANVVKANCIYALDNGKVIESGRHEELLNNHNIYYRLWSKQKELETYGIGGIDNEAA